MDRSIPLLLIGLGFGGGIGFAIAAGKGITIDGHDHDNPAHHVAGSGQAGQGAGHDHDTPYELGPGDTVPTLALTVTPDPATGWNLHVEKTGFRFSPENAGRDHVPGEGHGHVYVNGVKLARLYADWMHIDRLPEGDAVVEVGLYTNDHRPLFAEGAPVVAAVTVAAPSSP